VVSAKPVAASDLMGILDTAQRDLTTLSEGFASWLRSREPSAALRRFEANDSGAGFSNATYLATVTVDDGPRELVIRSGPPDPHRALFPSYDILKQFHVMAALRQHTDIPVPRCRWLESDPTLFGTPFFVMDKVDGQIPSDQPSYLTQGIVTEASDAQRKRMWADTVGLLARVGQVDWQSAGLHFLQHPDTERCSAAQELDHDEYCFRWGRRNSPDFPEMERALLWLRVHLPVDEPRGLLWGDARLPNIVYHDHQPICLLDWEMASIGNPESDLAWFLLRQFDKEHNRNPADARPRPAGFASDADTIALYENLTGRAVEHLEFYRAFNAFKTLAWMQRFFDLLVDVGQLTIDQAEAGKIAGGSMLSELLAIVDD
jgi:aminoglycoside phosphotransferase (APT) family kinase protein